MLKENHSQWCGYNGSKYLQNEMIMEMSSIGPFRAIGKVSPMNTGNNPRLP